MRWAFWWERGPLFIFHGKRNLHEKVWIMSLSKFGLIAKKKGYCAREAIHSSLSHIDETNCNTDVIRSLGAWSECKSCNKRAKLPLNHITKLSFWSLSFLLLSFVFMSVSSCRILKKKKLWNIRYLMGKW